MCFFSLVAGAAEIEKSGTYGNNLTWTLDTDGVLVISGKGEMAESSTTENWNWFSHKVKKIVVSNGVTTIAPYAFSSCREVTEVVLPDTVTTIGDGALGYLPIKMIDLPSGLKTIGNGAFQWCENLEKVTLPSGLTTINDSAFSRCKSLKEIIIPDTVTTLGRNAFEVCESLYRVKLPSNMTAIPDHLFQYCYSLVEIEIPSTVTKIGDWAFYRCKKLKTINIPSGVTVMGIYENPFEECESLISIDIPAGVKELELPFRRCWALESINVSPSNPSYRSVDGTLYSKDMTFLYQHPSGHKAESFTIPATVTNLYGTTFANCYNLKNIYVAPGNSMYSSIDGVLFRYKYYLIQYPNGRPDTSYKIPDGTKGIYGGFAYSNNLISVEFPDSVTDMSGSFENCEKLTYVDLGDGLEGAISGFANCKNLTMISIPRTVTEIYDETFMGCDKLAHIYYSGTQQEWEAMPKGEYNNDSLFSATVHFGDDKPVAYEYHKPESFPGTAYFNVGLGKAAFNYDDSWFDKGAYGYNHDLAKMTMRLAASAFASSGVKTQYTNVERLLDDLHFEGITHNEWYTKAPETNSIAVAVGRKHIAFPEENTTIIAVAIRGRGYKNEWGGNFNVGTGDHHQGFALARDQVVDFVEQYIKDQKIGGNIKLWITGYSRAAATANLTAAYFDEHCSEIGGLVSLKPADIFAYCFEAPAGVVNPVKDELYNNIFSIVNDHDFVPMVAMRKWGFDRYGRTKYLPTAYTHSDYTNATDTGIVDRMELKYKEYTGEDYDVDNFYYYYISSDPNDTEPIKKLKGAQGIFLNKVINKLADAIGNTAVYEEEYQEAFEFIGSKIVGEKKFTDFGKIFKNELIKKGAVVGVGVAGADVALAPVVKPNPALNWASKIAKAGTAYLTLRAAVKDTLAELGYYNVSSSTLDGIVGIFLDMGLADAWQLLTNISKVGQGHDPLLCLAWLDVMTAKDFAEKPLRETVVNCPVDVEVYDSSDRLVAAVYNNVPQQIEGSAIVAFVDENGQKIFYLPSDEEYRIEVVATDDGKVTYTVQEQDLETGKTKLINYNNMTVSKGDAITGTAENLNETTGVYPLKSTDVTVKTAEVISSGKHLNVKTTIEGNGSAQGDGLFYKREFAQVVATPAENEEFLGWYKGTTLVSSEKEYRFQVTMATDLTAKFTTNTCQVIIMDDEDYVVDTVRTLKGDKVVLPSNPKRSCDRFDGFYADVEFTTPLDVNAVYLDDTTVYAKFIKPLSFGDSYYFDVDGSTAEVVGSIGGVKDVVIADELDGYAPVKIADEAFAGKIITSIVIPSTVKTIGDKAFNNCPELTDVYYVGNAAEWNAVAKGSDNDSLETAKMHYLSILEISTIYDESFEQDDVSYVEATIDQGSGIKTVLPIGCELYYSTQRDVYAGLVPCTLIEGDTIKAELLDQAPVEFVYGNVDGDNDFEDIEEAVDSSDLQSLKRYLKGQKELSGADLIAADLDGDGLSDSSDLQALKQFLKTNRQFGILR